MNHDKQEGKPEDVASACDGGLGGDLEAERQARIESGDISFVELMLLARERINRLQSLYESGAPAFLLGKEIDLIEGVAADLRKSLSAPGPKAAWGAGEVAPYRPGRRKLQDF